MISSNIGKRKFTGRREILLNVNEITRENIVSVLSKALPIHNTNAFEINYLANYRNGDTPIFNRTKDVREEINNKISENRADEIVNFKTGYLVGEPIQYVTRKGMDEKKTEEIVTLNELMDAESRDTRDIELVDWLHVAGIGYKVALPDNFDNDEAPFEIFVPDPRNTFVVKNAGLGHTPIMGVHMVSKEDEGVEHISYSCYTKNKYFEIVDNVIVKEQSTVLDIIPIIEYRLNQSYLGAFEIVLPLLDAINAAQSNRLDGVEQFIQALMVFKGADIDEETFASLKEMGALKLPEGGDVDYLIQQLSQSDTQTLVDGLYSDILTICGMPNRNGSSSTSDTGSAVILRDGWSDAEARAKTSEKFFKESERVFLKLILKIVNANSGLKLRQNDIDIRFTRRNYENISSKAAVLTTLLGCEKVHPKLAFEHCGMFSDPTLAYQESMAYFEEELKREQEELERDFNNSKDDVGEE